MAETPEKVAVAKSMPRVAASPKSAFKRKRTDDLDAVSKEQQNQNVEAFRFERWRHEARRGGDFFGTTQQSNKRYKCANLPA